MVVPLSFPELCRLQKHRTSSTSIGLTACPLFIGLTACPLFIGLTACPLFIGLTPCPLHFLSRLRVLYLPWAVFMPLPSCVSCVSTTSRADTTSTASPPADYTSTTPGSLEHLRSLEFRATSNSVSTIPPRIAYSTFYHLCVDYSFVSTTSPCVNYSSYQHLLEIQCAAQNIFNERVMDRGYLGDVGRRTVMRFGTVDPKRPAVAVLAMHPRSLDSSWRE